MHGEAVMLCSSRLKHVALQYPLFRAMLTCVCVCVCVCVCACVYVYVCVYELTLFKG